MAVRLVIITGTCAVGKTTFASKLATGLGGKTPIFHLDDYISEPPAPGYPLEWARRRPGYLPQVGSKIAAALTDSAVAIFEGVLTGSDEIPRLTKAARLRPTGDTFTVIIRRPVTKCWERKSREPGFRRQYPFITSTADFARYFYDGYQPVGVVPDLELNGPEVDGPLGVERVVRRLEARD